MAKKTPTERRWYKIGYGKWAYAKSVDTDDYTNPLINKHADGYFITLEHPRCPWYGPIKSKRAAFNAALYLKMPEKGEDGE